ncbi:formate dehydrogenase accessory sulfurtransferase FdhD [Microbacterium halotolerans]|uniref:formate dehydrogenase accessory sulfurtransferase FdhD n=1 Tax=Microbacterium halotolerans TaxID=246613 RepID=UPI000E6ABEEF|nr:formate dehydrogenase accessory sulfurtransferase FdhD [Microbacterium halotolerans]
MGRITTRRPVTRVSLTHGERRRPDTLAVEEPLEIRIAGEPLAITMRTPGHDVELAAGFLVSEGVVRTGADFRSAIHCGGPGTNGLGMPEVGAPEGADAAPRGVLDTLRAPDGGASASENTYNVLDVALAHGVALPSTDLSRNFYTTSSCGMCGKASIDAVRTESAHDVAGDAFTIDARLLAEFPDTLRDNQDAFDKTGGLHAAGLFDAATGELLVLREDVGRHNAVDKVVGWAVLNNRLPLRGTVLMVSGRASFELVQKALMAGIPMLSAVSAPSSLAVELADEVGLTLVGFLRGDTMNIYTGHDRILVPQPAEV